MANNYEITVYAQPSLYQPKERTLDIYFAEPEQGITSNTGILLLSAGYGGQANSRVFCKMREQFADRYDYVTVQCNYFGWEFMQNVVFTETPDFMNDMGPVQAIDLLTALKIVSDILHQNEYIINRHRIHAYGFSHGAYLHYLMNAFMPGVLTGMIDNSAYLFPAYIDWARGLSGTSDHISDQDDQRLQFVYLIHDIVDDREIYDLPYIYSQFENRASIIAFHGCDDAMTTTEEKFQFLDGIRHARYELINEQRLDGNIFRTTGHGLGADFLQLFDYVMENYSIPANQEGLEFRESEIATSRNLYHIDMQEDVPHISRYHR